MTNFDPNRMSQAQKYLRKVIKAPVFALNQSSTLCSKMIVTFNSTCNTRAAHNDVVNVSTSTFDEYSAKRFSTTRSMRNPV